MGISKGAVTMRQDLLALTIDDLIVLSNRGIVKRAQQELQSGQLSFELSDDNSNIMLRWSDEVECSLPSNHTVSDSQCSCPATSICRHLIRSVLAYQQAVSPQNLEVKQNSTPWNPGDITDEILAQHYRKATINKLRKQFDEGHVVSLSRSSKPIAHIHTLSCTTRFLVAKDVRYTHCDCAESTPCSHVPLSVWAFRLLEAGKSSGIISTRQSSYPVPTPLLNDIEQQLWQLTQSGIAGANQALVDRFRRLAIRCRENSLIWLAEIISELIQEQTCYASHDARFSPHRVAELIGELCIRSDAIRNDTKAVPQLFIRGSEADRAIELGSARLIGLGCGVQPQQHGVELTAYMQDVDLGTIVAVNRYFPDPPPESTAKDFWQLAQTPTIKGISLATLGAGQLLTKGGKRTPNYQFLPGRAPVSFNPQAYQWEMLRPPALVEFDQSALSTLPPASLRPRRLTENLYVCKIAEVEAIAFNSKEQSVQAVLQDGEGNQAMLIHPYVTRGQEGTEALLSMLSQNSEALQFVAGQFRLSSQGLTINPISLIFQETNGRVMLQPWVDRWDGSATGKSILESPVTAAAQNPLASYFQQIVDALSELFLTGLQRVDIQTVRYWQELHRQGAALGFVRFLDPINQLVTALTQKMTTLHWDWQPAARAMLEIALLVKLVQEEFGSF